MTACFLNFLIMRTYRLWGAPVGGIALPESAHIALYIAQSSSAVPEPSLPQDGTVAEDPEVVSLAGSGHICCLPHGGQSAGGQGQE